MSDLHASIIADTPRLGDDEARLIRLLYDRLLGVGRRDYGVWRAAQETRDMVKETRDELLDGVVYLCMDAVMRADRGGK
jgi:uncharacterized ferritin-like protein (DUF455 family)